MQASYQAVNGLQCLLRRVWMPIRSQVQVVIISQVPFCHLWHLHARIAPASASKRLPEGLEGSLVLSQGLADASREGSAI